jgi:hypothetical protein
LVKNKTGNIRSNIEARSRNHSWCGKAISITYYEPVFVAFVIQPVKGRRRVLLSSVACQSLPYFPTLLHKRHDFIREIIEHKMCVLIFSTNFIINTQKFACKVHVILVGLKLNPNFLGMI